MLPKICFVALLVSATLAFPAESPPSSVTPVPIVSQSNDVNGDGNFTYTFETGNGIKLQQTGFVKPAPPGTEKVAGDEDSGRSIQVISGSYAYTAPDGTAIELSYVADENGFQPQGAHLPTPPPVPAEIQNLLSSLPAQPASAASELAAEIAPVPSTTA